MSQYYNLPQELREKGKFNCWRYIQKPNKEKPDKVPFNPKTGGQGQSGNPGTFTDFQTALAVVGNYDGLGIGVFGKLAITDIDDCVETDGTISEIAQDIIASIDSYSEISPSGTGVRIIAKVSDFDYDTLTYYINNQELGLEIYLAGATNKFLTVTGNVIHAAGIADCTERLQAVLDKYMRRPEPMFITNFEGHSCLTDEEVYTKASRGKDGELFVKLWDGEQCGYPSSSEADIRLMGFLCFYCGGDYEQMERVYSQSERGSKQKWIDREDYRKRTICKAISTCKKFYTPDYHKTDPLKDFLPENAYTLIKPAVEIESREVPWLIEGFIIRGALTSLQGLPDSGKSFLTCALTVALANGGEFPKADGTMMTLTPGRVLIANFDDALEFGVKPRLEKLGLTAEGAKRVFFLDPVTAAGVTFDDPRLAAVFDECKPDLAIFDTLQHFIGGKVDLHRANETNAAMAQLKLLAEKYDTGVIIVQHISKNAAGGNGGASVLWGLGSTAINGLFRSVWTVGKVKGEDETLRAAVSSKNNLLPYVPPALQYSLSQERGFEWRGVSREVTARDLIRGDDDKHSRGRPSEKRDEAADFIRDTLMFGKVKASIIYDKANLIGLSERTLKRAKARLCVRTFKEGKEWYWDIHSDGLYRRHKDRADSCGVERDDCRQVCWFAFLDAIKAYNAKSDTELKFSTFIKFPVRRRVYELFGYRTSKREPLNGAVSLDAPLPGGEDENITVGDTITDPSAETPYEVIDDSDIAAEVEGIISDLPPKQAAAIRGRFWQDRTLTEVGAEMGLTPKQIHNQYRVAIHKLRRDKRLQEIHDAYYANTTFTKHTGFRFFKENGMSSVEWYLIRLEERLERAKGGDYRDGMQ